MLVLFYKPACPFCHHVLDVVDELGLDVVLRNVSADPDTRAELIEKTGKSQVPYLLDTERDVRMHESKDIIAYLRKHYSGETEEKTAPKIHRAGPTCEAT